MTIDIEKLKLLANNVRDYKSVVHKRVISMLNDSGHDCHMLMSEMYFVGTMMPYVEEQSFYCSHHCDLYLTIKWLFDYLSDGRGGYYKESYDFELNSES